MNNEEKPEAEVVEFHGMNSRRGRALGRLFEVVKAEDGTPFEIRWVDRDRLFFVAPEQGFEMQSKNPDALRDHLQAWIRENVTLVWESFIVIECYPWEGRGDLFGLRFQRFFRAPRRGGGFLYRNFDANFEMGSGVEVDDVVEGKPGAVKNEIESRDAVVVPYTAERWLELRRAVRAVEMLKGKAREFVKERPEVVAGILDGMNRSRAPFLIANPEGESIPKKGVKR